jgi:hypothetical protein
VIELPDDFRDLLVELADADADFVVLGGYAVADVAALEAKDAAPR